MLEIIGLAGGGGLSCVYFALLLVGILYALFILVTGGLHEVAGDLGGHDFDLGGGGESLQGSVDVTHVSPVTIAGFVTAFGAFGIISQSLFQASTGISLVWASVGGV